jgi:hypothetical protein
MARVAGVLDIAGDGGAVQGLDSLAKLLILFGLVLAAIGGLLLFIGKVPFIGRLPGDIYVQRRNFSFYFPLTTSILLSILLTILFSLFRRR